MPQPKPESGHNLPVQKSLFDRFYRAPLEIKHDIARDALQLVIDELGKAGLSDMDETGTFAKDILRIMAASLP